jgi:hypothetical protein
MHDLDILVIVRRLNTQPVIAGTWTFVPLGDRSMASNAEILTRHCIGSMGESY